MDCNIKLVRRGALLSLMLPSALPTFKAYQLPFNSPQSSVFGDSLLDLLERTGEVATQKQSLEEALGKSVKGAKAQKPFKQ